MLLQRMLRASLLEPRVFDELRRDRSATGSAFTVVLIVAACTLIGTRSLGLGIMVQMALGAIMGWLFWSMIAMMVAQRFGGRAEFDEVVRPLAFAQSPQVLMLFGFMPGWGLPLAVGTWLWSTVASFVAVREALRLDGREAGLTVLFTLLIVAAINVVTGMTFGAFGMLLSRIGL